MLDRIKDMINRDGENIYCVEVENALIGAPGVGEVAVVGVPDSIMGEKVGAVIVPLPGVSVDPQQVVSYARDHLADYKVPQFIAVCPKPLPRNADGKVCSRLPLGNSTSALRLSEATLLSLPDARTAPRKHK